MARPLRIEFPGALYHVTSRGNAQAPIYLTDQDRQQFLSILADVVKDFALSCYAYCLMDNHYHLLIETQEANLSKSLRQLNGVYTQRFNRAHRRVGHILQGRFKAILVQKDSHLLELCRYIVLNPVRAKMCAKPEEWKWSSYQATAGSVHAPAFLNADWVLSQFGAKKSLARSEYRKFVTAGIGSESPWATMAHPTILGDDDFIDETTQYFDLGDLSKEFPSDERNPSRPALKQLFLNHLDNRKARNVMILRAYFGFHYSQAEIAKFLKIHYSNVSKIVASFAKIQDSRPDPK